MLITRAHTVGIAVSIIESTKLAPFSANHSSDSPFQISTKWCQLLFIPGGRGFGQIISGGSYWGKPASP